MERFVRSCAWTTAAVVGSRLAALIGSVLTARVLGRDQVGHLAAVQGVALIVLTIFVPGLSLVVTRFVAESVAAKDGRLKTILISGQLAVAVTAVCLAGLCFALAEPLATYVLNASSLATMVRAAAAIVLFNTLGNCQTGILSALREYRWMAVHSLLGGGLTLALMYCGAHLAGPLGAIGGLAAASAVQCLFGQWLLSRQSRESSEVGIAESSKRTATKGEGGSGKAEGKPDVSLSFRLPLSAFPLRRGSPRQSPRQTLPSAPTRQEILHLLPVIFRAAIPAASAGAIILPAEWAAVFIMLRRPEGFQEVGLYHAASLWLNALMLAPSLIGQSSLPLIAERRKLADTKGAMGLALLAVVASLLMVVPVCCAGWLWSGPLMSLNGEGFQDAVPALKWLLGVAVIVAMQTPISMALQASNRSWSLTGIFLISSAFYLAQAAARSDLTASSLAECRCYAYCLQLALLVAYVAASLRTSQVACHRLPQRKLAA